MEACDLFGVIITVTVLMLLSSSPVLPKFSLASLTVTKLNNSTGDRSFSCLYMQFQVLNPNLVTDTFYNDVHCSVYHGKHRLASTVSPPPGFFQRAGETTQINVTINLMPGAIASGVRNDLATYGVAQFDVKLTAVIKWRFRSPVSVGVSCQDVAVVVASGGTSKMIGPARVS